MRLISTTITNARSDVIGKALAAIPSDVEECHLIDTGADEATLEIALDVLGDRLHLHSFKWVDDFSAARNFALDVARSAGADWVLTADTDETLTLGAPGELAAYLATVPEGVQAIMVPHASLTFAHPRLIRLPTALRWHEPVHEYLPIEVAALAPAGWNFACQHRPTEDAAAKYRYYAKILERRVREAPNEPRAWFYLGDTCAILGMNSNALSAWGKRLRLRNGNMFEGAWAGWRAALLVKKYPELAASTASPDEWLRRGLTHDPNHSESMWLLGHLAYERGAYREAREWAKRALASGERERGGSFCFRRGQRELPQALLDALPERPPVSGEGTPQPAE